MGMSIIPITIMADMADMAALSEGILALAVVLLCCGIPFLVVVLRGRGGRPPEQPKP